MSRASLIAVLLVSVVTACKEKPSAEPAPAPVAPPATPAATATVVNTNVEQGDVALEQVPVSEEFEEQAALAITTENLDAEIQSLEAEIGE